MTWIAAKTQAISIHIIAATQHPDEKVISGIIKASFPIRGPFKIVGETCSKIILNAAGAEDFLENIDMLLDDGKGNIQRLQGGCLEYEG
ncbi:MAG: DNA translocase FtsK, partial [Lentisphaeria bacterium]